MALRRYRHFWGSTLEDAALAPAVDQDGNSIGDLENGDDLTSIIKAYNPPEFARSVRQVPVGKVMNERILGRLDAEATNFSITMSSDFERLYGYNHDYRFRIVEEMHSNDSPNVRYATDLVTGTMFRREWASFQHNDQDRDVTMHFLLRKYTRLFSDNDDGSGFPWYAIDIDVVAGEFRHAGRVTLTTAAGTPTEATLDASYPAESATFFSPNKAIRRVVPLTPAQQPMSPFTRMGSTQ